MGGKSGSKKQLGKIMLQQKLVTPDQLKELGDERAPGDRGSDAEDRLPIPEALAVLAQEYGLPAVDLTQEIVELSALKLIPAETALEYGALPFRIEGECLLLAMADPTREDVNEELGFLAGHELQLHVALQGVLEQTTREAYEALGLKRTHFAGVRVDDARRSAVGLPSLADATAATLAAEREMIAEAESRADPAAQAEAADADAADHNGEGERSSGVELQPIEGGAAEDAAQHPAAIPPPPPDADTDADAEPTSSVHRSFPPPPMDDPAPTASGLAPGSDEALSEAPLDASELALSQAAGGGADDNAQVADSITPILDAAFAERSRPSVLPQQSEYADRSVLVAQADPDLRNALNSSLADAGIELRHAGSDQGALAQLQQSLPSLLVLGVEVAEASGFDLCRRLKHDRRFAGVPVIMTSARKRGWHFQADLEECFGVAGYFEAPYDIDELNRTTRLLLEGKEVDAPVMALSAESQAQLDGAMQAFEDGDLDLAITHLEAGASMTPDSFELQYHLGLLYGRRDDLFLAITALETAAERRPRHFSTLKNLAVVYQRAGFRHRAVETWQRAMWLAPDDETRLGIKQHMIAML